MLFIIQNPNHFRTIDLQLTKCTETMSKLKLPFIAIILSYCTNFVAGQGLVPRICPQPQECDISATEYYALKNVVIECPDPLAATWAEKHLKSWYGKYAPTVTVGKNSEQLSSDAYKLRTYNNEIQIKASTLQGVRYALYSLRQIVMPARGTKSIEGWIVPRTEISDFSVTSFRGIHICWFHETDPQQIERLVRLAAYYKLNYAVIEPWGSFRSDVAPWYGWEDGSMTKKEIARIKKIADDLGITLIPQLNVFGHATMSRSLAGKHAGLDFSPKYQPLFEPAAGWNWCLSNPETLKLIVALIKELHKAFGQPPYFHIGCDEADSPSCPECLSVPYSELFLNHLKAINSTITSLGARSMMWHDMLLERGDKRWNGFYANGNTQTASAANTLPKDIIICDWYYGSAKTAYPTLDYFMRLGYDVLTCPWYDVSGIDSQGSYAQKVGLYGVLGTLWHHFFGNDLVQIYTHLSNVCWNANPKCADYPYSSYVQTHLRQVGWDMGLKDSKHTGLYFEEIPLEPVLNN